MKRALLFIALCGSMYSASAQVGIGTPEPATSAELEILSKTRGVLIPRVKLTDLTVFSPIEGDKVESLLIYNTGEDVAKDLLKGFYYWTNDAASDGGQWNRIVSKTELNTVIAGLDNNVTKIEGDVKNIQDLLNYIVPTNPGNSSDTLEKHTTIVYDPATNEFKQVQYNAETKTYEAKDVDFEDVVLKEETKTFFRELAPTGDNKTKKFLFFSETTIQNWVAKDELKNTVENIPNDAEGVVVIDVIGEIAQNITSFFTSNTTVLKEGSTSEYFTIEELIQQISSKVEGNVIYKNSSTTDVESWEFQFYNNGKYETINLTELIAATETLTVVVPVLNDDKVVGYKYFNEAEVKRFLADNAGKTVSDITGETPGGVSINVVGDVVNNFKEILYQDITEGNNTYKVGDLITQYINKGGNVYYGKLSDDQAEVFYTIDTDGTKKEINFDFIANYITNNVEKIKNILGDHISIENSEVIFTGNTINGNKVFKFLGTTVIAKANSAKTSGVVIPAGTKVGSIVSIQVLQGEMLRTTSTTDIRVEGNTLHFNIGSGNQYFMIGAGDYNVIVEFTELK